MPEPQSSRDGTTLPFWQGGWKSFQPNFPGTLNMVGSDQLDFRQVLGSTSVQQQQQQATSVHRDSNVCTTSMALQPGVVDFQAHPAFWQLPTSS